MTKLRRRLDRILNADPRLFPFAARSLLAGLEKLKEEGRAVERDGRWQPAP